MTQLQKSQLRPKCRKILEKYRGYNFILDDESYFTLSHTETRYYHSLKNIINMISQIRLFYKKIEFLPKIINLANAPKLRPIEDFWGILKTNVYENNWSAKNVSQLKKKIQLCLKKMDSNLVQKIAGTVQKRLNTVRRNGYDAL